MMKTYDALFIGWGKAAKTLTKQMAFAKKRVALIEKDRAMAGGSCINIACIPTKVLAQQSAKGDSFDEAMSRRNVVVEKLNEANYQNLASEESLDIIFGNASFINNHEILVTNGDDQLVLSASEIYINSGSEPSWPDIPNIQSCPQVYDSTTIQQLDYQPQSLAIIGAGPIGLEFANIYQKLGTQVTLFTNHNEILRHEETEIRQAVAEILLAEGINVQLNTHVRSVDFNRSQVEVSIPTKPKMSFDAILVATGRHPAIADLKLENTDIELNDRNGIKTNEFLETTVPGVFALGDVRGAEQFTYTSLDDSRIINGHHILYFRKNTPYSIFIDPVLSRVGLTSAQAKAQGFTVKVILIPIAKMPRSHVNHDPRGLFMAVINQENDQILGASLLGQNSEEIINIVKLAMDHNIPAKALANQVFTHPTMAENLNDFFQ